jgi:hypothetical protein
VLLRWINFNFKLKFNDVDQMRFGKSPASSWTEGYKTDTFSTRYDHPVKQNRDTHFVPTKDNQDHDRSNALRCHSERNSLIGSCHHTILVVATAGRHRCKGRGCSPSFLATFFLFFAIFSCFSFPFLFLNHPPPLFFPLSIS